MKPVRIKDETYCLNTFAKQYNFKYNSVRTFYNYGYRDEHLLEALMKNKKKKHAIKLGDKVFKSKLAAAEYFKIPHSTFYRYAKRGRLNELINRYNKS